MSSDATGTVIRSTSPASFLPFLFLSRYTVAEVPFLNPFPVMVKGLFRLSALSSEKSCTGVVNLRSTVMGESEVLTVKSSLPDSVGLVKPAFDSSVRVYEGIGGNTGIPDFSGVHVRD